MFLLSSNLMAGTVRSIERKKMATEDKLNDYDFTGTDAGASHTIPSEAGQIRKGGYIVIKGHPCKVGDDNKHSGVICFVYQCYGGFLDMDMIFYILIYIYVR